ncbi:PAS domain-containing sensor histidine kinase [Roseimarinus sediminis]|uniref:PAS domain-containing sensor histidine kinase n=1 Tax=Roseimarinus sediminis TaxID=1610899 RepID=UPI003D223770
MHRKFIFRLIFPVLLSSFFLIVWVYGRVLVRNLKEGIQNEFSSVGEIRHDALKSWYDEERSDAFIIANNQLLLNQYLQWQLSGNQSDSLQLDNMSSNVVVEHGYHHLSIVNEEGTLLFSSLKEKYVLDGESKETALLAFRTDSVQLSNFYISRYNQQLLIDFASPVQVDQSNNSVVFIFHIDPSESIFPQLQAWTINEHEIETWLAFRDKGMNYFVSCNGATSITNSIGLETIEGALFSGLIGTEPTGKIVETIHSTSEKVLTYFRPVKGTPWFLIAHIGQSKIYDTIYQKGKIYFVLVFLILLLLVLATALMYNLFRKRFFRSMLESQEEFRTTLYSIGDAVITTDPSGRVKHMNPIAEQLTGWKEAEAAGNLVEEVFHIISEESRKPVESPVLKVLHEGVIVGLANHTLLISKDGNELPIADSGAPIFDKGGKIIGVVLVFRDQLEERRQQQVIEESRRQLYTLMSNLPGMAYRCLNDEQWTMEFVSKGCEKLTGYKAHEIMHNASLSYADLIVEEDRGKVWRQTQQSLDKKEAFELEYRIKTCDGAIKWVWERGQGVFDQDEILLAIEGFVSDITEKVKQDEQLRYNKNLLNTIVESIPDALYMKDVNGRKMVANSADVKNCGYLSKEEVIGKTDFDLFPPELAHQFWKSDHKVIHDGIPVINHEELLSNRNGEEKWLQTSKVPFRNEKGEIVGLVGIGHDITYRKKILNDLLAAKAKAEEGDRLKTAFLANMSHEIRTPLNSILGFTGLITERNNIDEEERREYLKIINNSADGLIQIINDIIDISSLETGQMKIHLADFNLNKLLDSLHCEMQQKIDSGKNIELVLLKPDHDLYIRSDEYRLKQVFSNLLTNAIKFTVKGKITFGLVQLDEEQIVLKVEDTGVGIEEELHQVIFERFRQGHVEEDRNYGGNGLGLAIVKNLVELLGGSISLKSETGKGSCFTVIIPLRYKIPSLL